MNFLGGFVVFWFWFGFFNTQWTLQKMCWSVVAVHVTSERVKFLYQKGKGFKVKISVDSLNLKC